MPNKEIRPTVNKWRKTDIIILNKKQILLHYYHSLLEINVQKKFEGEVNNRRASLI